MEMRTAASASRTAGLVLVTVVWAIFLALTGSPEAILFTLPVFLIAAPLAFGRYVGEEVLGALRADHRRRGAREISFGLVELPAEFIGLVPAGIVPGRGPPLITR